MLLVGIAAVAALLMSNRGGGPAPEAEVITLPPRTPTVAPVDREPGTDFFEALPSTSVAFALSATADAPDLVLAGALEAYTLEYTDGEQQVVVVAGQWPSEDDATAAYQAMADAAAATAAAPAPPDGEDADGAGADGEQDGDESPAPQPLEEGAVQVCGTEVGRYTIALHADGTATMVWRNGTVVLRADGPAAAVRELYTGYAL